MNSVHWTWCDLYSPKQIALFESVIAMLEEDVPVSGIKVADIAARAGVGKGTTYEYFSSKEELIASAIFYDVRIRFSELEGRVDKITEFRKIYEVLLDWIDENLQAKHVLRQILGMDGIDYQLPVEICKNIKIQMEAEKPMEATLKKVRATAVEEGIIAGNPSKTFWQISFISNLFAYVGYLRMEMNISDVTKNQIKEFLYNALIRALQV